VTSKKCQQLQHSWAEYWTFTSRVRIFGRGFFSIFTAGISSSDIAFRVYDDISLAGANANGSSATLTSGS
jgi:hypothetical protein